MGRYVVDVKIEGFGDVLGRLVVRDPVEAA